MYLAYESQQLVVGEKKMRGGNSRMVHCAGFGAEEVEK